MIFLEFFFKGKRYDFNTYYFNYYNHFDDCITKKQIKDLKKYLEDPNREIFEDEDPEE
mgnify:CR=1 FL=1